MMVLNYASAVKRACQSNELHDALSTSMIIIEPASKLNLPSGVQLIKDEAKEFSDKNRPTIVTY